MSIRNGRVQLEDEKKGFEWSVFYKTIKREGSI